MIYSPDSTKLNGILQRKRRLFTVFASDYSAGYNPERALNQENSYFHTNYTEALHWYCIKFKSYFNIKSYTIKTRYIYEKHPKEWSVEGSNDFIDWHTIDEKNTDVFVTNNQTENFPVDKPGIYKYIKLTQIKNTSDSSRIFTFGSIDLFGTYIADCTLRKQIYYSNVHLICFITFILSV